MEKALENNHLTICLEGRIDSNNAPAVEREIMFAVRNAPGANVVLDAEKLEYISSAGLRVLMKLRKQAGTALSVMNASPEVYDVFEVTGFTALFDIRRRLRQISIDGCEMIGRGGNGAVYRLDQETILKLYNEGTSLEKIALEKKYATAAFTAGLPCAIAYDTVRSGDRYGIVFELLNAVTVGRAVDRDPALIPEMGRSMGALLRQLHTTEMPSSVLPKMTDKMTAWIDYLEEKYIDHADAELMRSVLAAFPEKNTLVHADFHEGNVMLQGDELILIDLDDVCTGNPLFDLAAHYSAHVLAAKAAPEGMRYSMGMEPETGLAMYRHTVQAYLGTDDAQQLAAYERSMQLLTLFFTLIYLAKGKDSKNLTPERAQGVLTQILPQFRQMAPMIRRVVQEFQR
ncbi:MAG: anti-sigma factor antagonist [Clostridia bacterium]|nr:anti-sigma factor antagonist [Clostridia bacterium]